MSEQRPFTTEPMTPDERIALLEREVSAAQYRIERDGAEIDRLRSQLTDFHNVDDVGEIRRLRAENEQLRTEYAACIATVDRLENGSAADVGEKP